jgi:hypothetical protein
MITLKTLPQATAQQVFDQVAKHLLDQKQCSYMEGKGCRYRTKSPESGKLKCAAGCLIDDEEYCSKWEGDYWGDLIAQNEVPSAHRKLIVDLQHLHDLHPAETWRVNLEFIADTYDLDTKVLGEATPPTLEETLN